MASPRARATASDIARVVAGAIRGGWPVGSFEVQVVDRSTIRLLPAGGLPASDADDCERRMREAFGEDDGAHAIRR